MIGDETPEERMRAGLYGVYARWQTIHGLGGVVDSLATAMALEAMRALSEAYPDDPLYRRNLADLQRDYRDL